MELCLQNVVSGGEITAVNFCYIHTHTVWPSVYLPSAPYGVVPALKTGLYQQVLITNLYHEKLFCQKVFFPTIASLINRKLVKKLCNMKKWFQKNVSCGILFYW